MARTTTTRKTSTTAKKTTTARKKTTARKPAAAPKAPKAAPVVVSEAKPVLSGPEMKKKELIDMVVERSGIKKRYAKPTIEAALAVLGEALDEGRELNLRPFGKMKVQRAKDVANGKVMMVRLRQPKNAPDEAKEGVADAAE
ncbi:MAG: DNA-binding protein [Rhodobacteraceae bacterium]|nr:DNA-binding protein [Paracoccaceae bacterium]